MKQRAFASYRVEPDYAQLREVIRAYEGVGGDVERAINTAINKAGPKIRTKSSREIRKQVRLPAKYVRKKLKFQRSTYRKLEGKIRAPKRGVLLTRFVTDPLISRSGEKVSWFRPPPVPSNGIMVKVKPRGSALELGGKAGKSAPFYMIGQRSKALLIVQRVPGAKTRKGKDKFDALYGPSVSQVFGDVKEEVTPAANEEYTVQLIDAMRFHLVKRFPK